MSINAGSILPDFIAAVILAALAYVFSYLFPDMAGDLRVVIAGLVAIVGGLSWHWVSRPIHEQCRLIDEIAVSLIFYANLYSNPGSGKREQMDEASKVLRQQASQLRVTTHSIRLYKLWQFLRIVPKQADVIEASKALMGLSNSIHQGDPMVNYNKRKKIKKWLRIRTDT